MKYKFLKHCARCRKVYTEEELSKEQYDELVRNPFICVHTAVRESHAILFSYCKCCITDINNRSK